MDVVNIFNIKGGHGMLDDSLSAVDAKTEEAILEALKHERKDATTIITSHRLSAISHAHIIIVMEEGTIVEKGTHEELMALRVNNNYEVDVIANWDKNYAIEVKSTTTETEKTERQLLKVDEILHETHIKKIYYTGDITTNSSKISYISWRDW